MGAREDCLRELFNRRSFVAKEKLRRRFRPSRVRLLFVGEAPPASGRFFYQADSGLYRATRDAFAHVFPAVDDHNFLELFQNLGCYLVDLCGRPVDRLGRIERSRTCREGEVRVAKILKQLQPEIVITVVRSIAGNVERSAERVNWRGQLAELPYPGRWHKHRGLFIRQLTKILRESYV